MGNSSDKEKSQEMMKEVYNHIKKEDRHKQESNINIYKGEQIIFFLSKERTLKRKKYGIIKKVYMVREFSSSKIQIGWMENLVIYKTGNTRRTKNYRQGE